MTKQTVAFIGTGAMGAPMAARLIDAGYPLRVFNRSKNKALPLIEKGAEWCNAPGHCAQKAKFVVTMAGNPRDVEEIYYGSMGIFQYARRGAVLIDMTTGSPAMACRISAEADARGMYALDAPVSGDPAAAAAASLRIFVGGEQNAFAKARPLLKRLGKRITHIGPAGAGQHAKMAGQIAIAGILGGLCEAVAYVEAMGINGMNVLHAIGEGAADSWQMRHNGERILSRDPAGGLPVRLFAKDMDIALMEADERELTLPIAEGVRGMYRALQQRGMNDCGIQSLIQYFDH
ncbi:MAG: NAD(P)-dependent oxidoreductase [Clostridiales bacterium]|jgi:3-hydroxyisobutyrate dehydrogenase-like beta-hydroxyacid dehydrogenase|nr:NAD(P)-dependent oxidoreductase [Clostridiales bacterium]